MTNSLTNDIVVGGRLKRRIVTFSLTIDWQKEQEKADRRHQRRLKRKLKRRRKTKRMTFTQEARDDASAALIMLIDKREEILRMCEEDTAFSELVRKCAKAIGYSHSSKDDDKIQLLTTSLGEMATCAKKGTIKFHQDDDRLVSMLLQISMKYTHRRFAGHLAGHLATHADASKDSVKAVTKADDNDEKNSDDKSSHSDGENDLYSHSGSEGSSGSEAEYSSMGCPDKVIVEIRMPLCEVSANTTPRSDYGMGSELSSTGSETLSESLDGESSSSGHDSCSESSESSDLPAKKKSQIY